MTNITAGDQPADEVAFSLITKQWGEYSEAKIEQLIDKRFIPLMKRINADPDMATMYCCSGHIKKEKSYDPEEISSYMVLLVRGKRVTQFQRMVNFIEAQPGYRPLARIPGWSWCGGSIPVPPWQYPIADLVFVNNITLYHIGKMSDDPTGMLTVQKWDDLFNKFIFGQPAWGSKNETLSL